MQGKNQLQPKRGAEEMQFLLGEQASSGLTVKEFCKGHHLSQAVFYYWQKKFRGEGTVKGVAAGFREIEVKAENNPVSGHVFAEYRGIRFYQEPSVSLLKQLIG
jgi:hypothetical protein